MKTYIFIVESENGIRTATKKAESVLDAFNSLNQEEKRNLIDFVTPEEKEKRKA